MTNELLGRPISLQRTILAALAALSLAAAIAPVVNAAPVRHQGPYDNTGSGPDTTGMAGGGG
jgi:hypothetical protein